MDFREPILINTESINQAYDTRASESETEYASADGQYDLYFSSGDFVTRSASTGGIIFAAPCLKANGDVPPGHYFRLINRNTGKELFVDKLRPHDDGGKWIHRFSSEWNLPNMPDSDLTLRAQVEYPHGEPYVEKDVVISNGPRSGLEPRCSLKRNDLPSELDPGDKYNVYTKWMNVGDEVGKVGINGYMTQMNPHEIYVSLPFITPAHPEFNYFIFSMDKTMGRKNDYLTWEYYYYSFSNGYIKEGEEEHTIETTDPAECNCSDCNTDRGCYQHSWDDNNVCNWENGICKSPSKECRTFYTHVWNLLGIPPLHSYDKRFDLNDDGKIDVDEVNILGNFVKIRILLNL